MTTTRLGAVLALVTLLLPAESSAQRIPLPGTVRPRPTRPAPLPPQPEPIARSLAYKRLRLSVESYPMISHIRASGLSDGGSVSEWTAFGTGTRADYRVSRYVALTMDLTSSFAGGPADVHTAELGARLRRERWDDGIFPFADVRVGHVWSYGSSFDPIGGGYGYGYTPTEGAGFFRYSSGFGGVIGAGVEYALTRTLSLTTAASVMRNHMTARDLGGARPTERSYDMTVYRYIIGLRYNPVRVVRPPMTDTR